MVKSAIFARMLIREKPDNEAMSWIEEGVYGNKREFIS